MILDKQCLKASEQARYDDKDLVKKEKTKTLALENESRQLTIEINIKKSKRDDYKSKIENATSQIQNLLEDKRALEDEHAEVTAKLEKKGSSANAEDKAREFAAEREKKLELKHEIEKIKEEQEIMNQVLALEEKKAKEMLDLKLNNLQKQETTVELAKDEALARGENAKK